MTTGRVRILQPRITPCLVCRKEVAPILLATSRTVD
jgi:hypothetical protein